jgi:hypothetical protein
MFHSFGGNSEAGLDFPCFIRRMEAVFMATGTTLMRVRRSPEFRSFPSFSVYVGASVFLNNLEMT